MRPAPLSEFAGPQGGLVAPSCPCGGVLSLVPVVIVQEAADDDTTIVFLLERALAEKQMEEEVKELEVQVATKEQLMRLF